ncbi:MAG TPA: DUF4432 domain-containing protein, partial [Opitutae bacterium]|nr:DUF4432 domain-containing protein [Opitutae bacterium]
MKHLMKIPALSTLIFFCLSCSVDENIEISTQGTVSIGNPSESILTNSSSHAGKQFSSPWTVTRKTLSGGKQQGVELLIL